MSSEYLLGKLDSEDFSSGHLLRDLENLSKAFYLHKILPKALNSSPEHGHDVTARISYPEQSKMVIQESLHREKKSSIWNWKPLKALTHIRHRRFNCCFFLHVHVIDGLPLNFDDLSLCVTWIRKDEMLTTRPSRVCEGTAVFEETLMHRCTVYGSRNGPEHSAKYEPKIFLLHASVTGAPAVDMGKHWIDLTRLLPVTLEEFEEDNMSSGKWTTSFKLTGMARGAMLNVSFGFSILGDESFKPGCFVKGPNIVTDSLPSTSDHAPDLDRISGTNRIHTLGSFLRNSSQRLHLQSESVRFLDTIFPDRRLAQSVTHFYQTADEQNMGNPEEFEYDGGNTINEFDDSDFTVIEQGVEVPIKDQEKREQYACQSFDSSIIEIIDVAEIFKEDGMISDENEVWNPKLEVNGNNENVIAKGDSDYKESIARIKEPTGEDENEVWNAKLEVNGNNENEIAKGDSDYKERITCIKEPTGEELDSVFYDLLTSRSAATDSLLDIRQYQDLQNHRKTKSSNKEGRLVKSHSLDDVAESIANDFLRMLSIDQNPDAADSDSGRESPRDRLLIQFEENTVAGGSSIFDVDAMARQKQSCCLDPSDYVRVACSDDFSLSLAIQAGERNHDTVTQSLSKRNAEVLDNLETEALMHEWGLNEKTFQNSLHTSSGGFGSPVYLPAEEPLKLPSLGEGLGPIIQTKYGGFLRSLNPLLFRNSKNGARLIMQVSASVVLPAAMGSSIMEILQFLVSGGVEKLSNLSNELMPLEDITGKTILQVVSEAESRSDVIKRSALQHGSEIGEKAAEKLPFAQNSDTLCSCSYCDAIESDYVCCDNLVPLAMANVEALLIEGLKIQSSMPDQETPSTMRVDCNGNLASLSKSVKHGGNLSLERASRWHLFDIDELMEYSVSLKEWMRLDAGDFVIEDQFNERIGEILSAHHAIPKEWNSGQLRVDDESVQLQSRSCGVFGNNFTMCLKVQLRDPFRNFEMVGSSMLALIQVERVHSPLQQAHNILSEKNSNGEEDSLDGQCFGQKHKIVYKNCIPKFKILEAHLAGLNVENGDKQLWGTRRQQQSGSRWLLSSGMSTTNEHRVSNSNAIVKSSTGIMREACPSDVLWSISSNTQGEAAAWDDLVALNIHARNPDIIFPN